MGKTSDDRTFVDTNVLLDATDQARPRHHAALALLQRRANLVLSAQVCREYLAVATRPAPVNGLGLEPSDALANLAEFRRVVRLLPEERAVLPVLLEILTRISCRGKEIHDAAIVATMSRHGVGILVTSNATDFDRFRAIIAVISLN